MRNYRSRLSQVEEQKSVKSAIVFGGLTLLIIVAAIFFGIPLFSKFTGLFVKNSPVEVTQNTTLPPPNLSALPKYTNKESIIVKGTAKTDSRVKVFFNNSSDETVVDSDGNFAANIGLSKGTNTIYAKLIDELGNESASSVSYTITYSVQVPNLTINTPQNNQTFYGDSQKRLSIEGLTDAGNSVTVNDHVVIVDSDGKFSFPFDLQNGENTFKVISLDQATNKKEIELKVTFNP